MTSRRTGRPYLGAPLLFLAALAAGCSNTASHPPMRHQVTIQSFKFEPDSLVVAPGDTVEWINRDILPHTATASDSAWDSGVIAIGSSWPAVIAARGVHDYVCRLHPTMKGRIDAR